MKARLVRKLRKEMLSWNRDSQVRHRKGTLRKAWQAEVKLVLRHTGESK